MATTYTPKFLKRTASQAQFETPAPKKPANDVQPGSRAPSSIPAKPAALPMNLQRSIIHFPKSKWDTQRSLRKNPQIIDEPAVQSLLVRSIETALEAVGFDAAESEALDSFRAHTEECKAVLMTFTLQMLISIDMAHILSLVRQSMLACRRLQALPSDFLQALHVHRLNLRALLPHLDPPVPSSKSQINLRRQIKKDDEQEHLRLLSSFLSSRTDAVVEMEFIPKHFPHLPSKHTYKATPEFLDREQDPRKTRERATEEGKLGEEALRRLVSAASQIKAVDVGQANKKPSARERRAEMWQQTMQEVSRKQSSPDAMVVETVTNQVDAQQDNSTTKWAGSLGSVVNADRRFWRKPRKS